MSKTFKDGGFKKRDWRNKKIKKFKKRPPKSNRPQEEAPEKDFEQDY